jgi:CHAD domain-containing protein
VLGPALAAAVRDLRAADAEIRLDRPAAVHAFRTSARRLRSILRATPSLFVSDGDLVGGLQEAGRTAGPTRNADVVSRRALRLLAAEPPGPVIARLAEKLTQDLEGLRRREWVHLVDYLDSSEYDVLTRRLDGFADLPPWSPLAEGSAVEVLLPLFDLEWRRFDARTEQVLGTPAAQVADEMLHDLRKQAKSVRYLGDAVKPVLVESARKVRKKVRRVQTLLGDFNDAVVALAYLDASLQTLGDGPAERRILRELHQQEARTVSVLRAEFLAGSVVPGASASAS